MSLFPLFLKLEGRPVLVVGGGEIAEGKIASLLHTGASVHVVAPMSTPAISVWAKETKIKWHKRRFQAEDVKDQDLVIAATSSVEVNHQVYAEARRHGVLCNVVDDPAYCDFYFPAVVRRGDLQIAISTGGQSPALAQQLRVQLENQFGPEYAERVADLGHQRREILATHPPGEDRKKLLHQLAQQGLEQALDKRKQHKTGSTNVYLVGAGPGDPELLTVKAHNLLRSADVILHDELVSEEILRMASPSAALINVGKRHGAKRITQDQINTLLVHFATQGSTVVRLKGGDPLIFGRAGEEIEALDAAGIGFEVVPGITAASAAAAAAQVSLTDRRSASTVIFTTPHHCAGKEHSHWLKTARRDATLAIYMPGSGYEKLAQDLEAAGFSDETACLIVSGAATHNQQARRTTLSHLAALPPLPAPSLLLVGEALACRQRGADLEDISSAQSFETVEEALRVDLGD
ncbi:MAG TPA: siroheme synthase CysG [Terriglobales bacterium]|jgi:uroporphyrin-III C-methyltransferase/precorrin-2 dehydrogenase/sirohydrochlorin ferrochelatase|nr:siroheme synthase CysG [Terriglobales bacterium]